MCPVSLLDGKAGITNLANLIPKAGDPITTYRKTYECQLVYELAHVVGAERDLEYGMPNCTKLAKGATTTALSHTPGDNTDSWALFALGKFRDMGCVWTTLCSHNAVQLCQMCRARLCRTSSALEGKQARMHEVIRRVLGLSMYKEGRGVHESRVKVLGVNNVMLKFISYSNLHT